MLTKVGSTAAMNDNAGHPNSLDLKSADYCYLAEECFFMAALAKDPEAAVELVKAGDEYLRRAAGWLADQIEHC